MSCLPPDHLFTDFVFVLLAENVVPLNGDPEFDVMDENPRRQLAVGE